MRTTAKSRNDRPRSAIRKTTSSMSRSPASRPAPRAGATRPPAKSPTVRKRSRTRLFGLPLWEIASGPDRKRGESRGHARAIFAVGDVADGVFALGGVARGVFTVGGISLGVLSLGGVAISLVGAMGGVAIAPLAYGGAAVGGVAVGGAAVGIYAKGDTAIGVHVIEHPSRKRRVWNWLQRRLRGA